MNISGTEIFVEKLPGTGSLNFVLIHNAGSDHRFFTHQLETLRKFGDVIQLDLPGSGKSQPISSYTMRDLSSIIARVCEKLSLENICLIGLNNGANIAIDMVLNHSLAIERLVLIDPPIFMNKSFVSEIDSYIESLEKAEFNHQFVAAFVDALFLNTDSSNKEIAASAFNGVNKKSLSGIFRGLLEWDATSAGILKKIACPTLCILTDEHHCSYEKMHREAPQFEIGKVVGSKCWATLEVPEQVNAMITRFLKIHSMYTQTT
ncbi:MAG: alpha/beta hydrolase [Chlamydiales bacterium]|nr:alpha/beta hydrolase [Chlamydiales bacterium]